MTFELQVEHWVSLYILVGMYQTTEDKSKWPNGRWKQANAHSLSAKFATLNHSDMKNENHYRKANCCTPDAAVFNSKAQKSHITQPATDWTVINPRLSVNSESFFLFILIFWCHDWNIGLWQTSDNSLTFTFNVFFLPLFDRIAEEWQELGRQRGAMTKRCPTFNVFLTCSFK